MLDNFGLRSQTQKNQNKETKGHKEDGEHEDAGSNNDDCGDHDRDDSDFVFFLSHRKSGAKGIRMTFKLVALFLRCLKPSYIFENVFIEAQAWRFPKYSFVLQLNHTLPVQFTQLTAAAVATGFKRWAQVR